MPSRPEMYTRSGLNWDLIRAEYMDKASPEERKLQQESLDRPMRDLIKKPENLIAHRDRQYPNSLTTVQRQLIFDLYQIGNTVPFISNEMNISQATVRKHLKDAKVYDPNRDRNRR